MTSLELHPVSADDHDDTLEEAFFSRPPPPVVHDVAHPEDFGPPPAMGRTEHSLMLVTGAMVGAAVLALLAFSAFGDQLLSSSAPVAAAPSARDVLAAISESRPTVHAAASALGVESMPIDEASSEAHAAAGQAPSEVQAEAGQAPSGAQLAADQASSEVQVASRAEEPSGFAAAHAPAAVVPAARKQSARPRAARRQAGGGSSAFDRLIRSARRDFDRGDPRSAQRKALDAIQLDPERGYAYVLLGAARDALGNASGAQAAYRLCTRQATDRHVSACKTLAR